MQMLSLYSQLDPGSKWVPLAGALERLHLVSVSRTVAAGTSGSRRNMIAEGGLEMPCQGMSREEGRGNRFCCGCMRHTATVSCSRQPVHMLVVGSALASSFVVLANTYQHLLPGRDTLIAV